MPKRKRIDGVADYVAASGIFARDDAIQYLEQALLDRETHQEEFEKDMTAFIQALTRNENARDNFYKLLEDTQIAALVEMVKRNTDTLQYHLAEHAAEVAYDTDMSLRHSYSHKFPHDNITNSIMRHLAVAAAAWHDVVQSKGAPNNEVESASEFVKHVSKNLSVLSKKHPDCASAIKALKKHLFFIANELIIYNTWLLFYKNPHNELLAKSLRQHASIFESKNNNTTYHTDHPMLERLWLAADTISISDTSRFALTHVREEKMLSNALTKLDENSSKAMNDFLKYAEINDEAVQEEFLGLIGQDIRMFSEINTPDVSHISRENYHYFMDTLHHLRYNENENSHFNYLLLIDLFITTLMKNASQPNIQREMNFAHAIGTDLWKRHAKNLAKLESYYALLNNSQKAALGQALFTLATAKQPGHQLLLANASFKQAILDVDKIHPILRLFRSKDERMTANLERYQHMFKGVAPSP